MTSTRSRRTRRRARQAYSAVLYLSTMTARRIALKACALEKFKPRSWLWIGEQTGLPSFGNSR